MEQFHSENAEHPTSYAQRPIKKPVKADGTKQTFGIELIRSEVAGINLTSK
jgi:hypothetical protein